IFASAVAEGQPHASFRVLLKLGQFVEVLLARRQNRLELRGGLLPLAIDQTLDADPPRLIQARRARVLIQIARVFAPLWPRLVPGSPEVAGPVAGQADVGAEQGSRLGCQNLAERSLGPVGHAPNPDAVAALVVHVP